MAQKDNIAEYFALQRQSTDSLAGSQAVSETITQSMGERPPEVGPQEAYATFGEKVDAGLRAGAQQVKSDVTTAGAIIDYLRGNTDAAEAKMERSRELEQSFSAILEPFGQFEEFLDEPTFSGFLDQSTKAIAMTTPQAIFSFASAGTGLLAGFLGKQIISQGGKTYAKQMLLDIQRKKVMANLGRGPGLTKAEQEILDTTFDGLKYAKSAPVGKGGMFDVAGNKYARARAESLRLPTIGAVTGALAQGEIVGASQSLKEYDDAGYKLTAKEAKTAIALGFPQAVLDVVGEAAFFAPLFKKATGDLVKNSTVRQILDKPGELSKKDLRVLRKAAGNSTAGEFLLDLGKAGAVGFAGSAVAEGLTERAQEEILIQQRFAIDPQYKEAEARIRGIEALFMGAMAGGARGAPSGVIAEAYKMVSTGGEMQQDLQNEARARLTDNNLTGSIDPSKIELTDDDYEGQIEAMLDPASPRALVWIPNRTKKNIKNLIDRFPKATLAINEAAGGVLIFDQNSEVSREKRATALENDFTNPETFQGLFNLSALPESGDIIIRAVDSKGRTIDYEAVPADEASIEAASRNLQANNPGAEIVAETETDFFERTKPLQEELFFGEETDAELRGSRPSRFQRTLKPRAKRKPKAKAKAKPVKKNVPFKTFLRNNKLDPKAVGVAELRDRLDRGTFSYTKTGGMGIDQLIEAAVDAGYLREDNAGPDGQKAYTVDDIVDLVNSNAVPLADQEDSFEAQYEARRLEEEGEEETTSPIQEFIEESKPVIRDLGEDRDEAIADAIANNQETVEEQARIRERGEGTATTGVDSDEGTGGASGDFVQVGDTPLGAREFAKGLLLSTKVGLKEGSWLALNKFRVEKIKQGATPTKELIGKFVTVMGEQAGITDIKDMPLESKIAVMEGIEDINKGLMAAVVQVVKENPTAKVRIISLDKEGNEVTTAEQEVNSHDAQILLDANELDNRITKASQAKHLNPNERKGTFLENYPIFNTPKISVIEEKGRMESPVVTKPKTNVWEKSLVPEKQKRDPINIPTDELYKNGISIQDLLNYIISREDSLNNKIDPSMSTTAKYTQALGILIAEMEMLGRPLHYGYRGNQKNIVTFLNEGPSASLESRPPKQRAGETAEAFAARQKTTEQLRKSYDVSIPRFSFDTGKITPIMVEKNLFDENGALLRDEETGKVLTGLRRDTIVINRKAALAALRAPSDADVTITPAFRLQQRKDETPEEFIARKEESENLFLTEKLVDEVAGMQGENPRRLMDDVNEYRRDLSLKTDPPTPLIAFADALIDYVELNFPEQLPDPKAKTSKGKPLVSLTDFALGDPSLYADPEVAQKERRTGDDDIQYNEKDPVEILNDEWVQNIERAKPQAKAPSTVEVRGATVSTEIKTYFESVDPNQKPNSKKPQSLVYKILGVTRDIFKYNRKLTMITPTELVAQITSKKGRRSFRDKELLTNARIMQEKQKLAQYIYLPDTDEDIILIDVEAIKGFTAEEPFISDIPNSAAIEYSPEVSLPVVLLALAHELGHAVFRTERQFLLNTNKPGRKLLQKAFINERDTTTDPKAKAQYNSKFGFEEWWSDKFATEILNQAGITAKEKNKKGDFVDGYFRRMVKKIKDLFINVRSLAFGERFSQDAAGLADFQTYVESVIAEERSYRSVHDALQGMDFEQEVQVRDLIEETIEESGKSVSRQTLESIKTKIIQMLRAKLPGQTTDKGYWSVAYLLQTSDGYLRGLGEAGKAIAKKLYSRSSSRDKFGFINARTLITNQNLNSLYDTRDENGNLVFRDGNGELNIELIAEAALQAEDDRVNTDDLPVAAKAMRKVLQDFYETYITPNNPNIRYKENFFSRHWLLSSIVNDPQKRQKLADLLAKYNPKVEAPKGFESWLAFVEDWAITDEDSDSTGNEKQSAEEDASTLSVGMAQERKEYFKNIPNHAARRGLDANGDINAEGDAGLLAPADFAIKSYIESITKKLEYEKAVTVAPTEADKAKLEELYGKNKAEVLTRLAEGETEVAGWRAMEVLLSRIEDDASREGARKAIEAQLGKVGMNMSPVMRQLNSWALLGNMVTLLTFAAIASLPDLAGPVLRSKDMNDKIGTIVEQLQYTIKNKKEAEQFARDLGVVTHDSIETMYINAAELGFMTEDTKRYARGFFRITLLEQYTKFTRVFAAGMGQQYLIRLAQKAKDGDETAIRHLGELQKNLTPDEVLEWASANKNGQKRFDTEGGKKVQEALGRFVEESIVRPNAAERPVWASNPYFALVWQLKSFFYAYGKNIVGGAIREGRNKYRSDGQLSSRIMPVIIMATLLLPLTAIGLELREFIKFLGRSAIGDEAGADRAFRSDKMLWGTYMFELLDRSGIYGPFGLLLPMAQAERYGDAWFLPALGPTAERFDDIFIDRTINTKDYLPFAASIF